MVNMYGIINLSRLHWDYNQKTDKLVCAIKLKKFTDYKFQFIGQLNRVSLHPHILEITPIITNQRHHLTREVVPFRLCSGVSSIPWCSRFGWYRQELCANWFADSGRMKSAGNRDIFKSRL